MAPCVGTEISRPRSICVTPSGDWARGISHSSHLSQSVTGDVEYWIELLALCIMMYKVIGSVCSQQDVVDIYWNLNIMY